MERNDRNNNREFENRYQDNNRNEHRRDYRDDSNEGFQNYRSRYSNTHGNYYGMRDDNAEYRNVRGYNSDPNAGSRSGGPVVGYGASSYRGVTESGDQDNNYRYGDPNPYMGNNRNRQNSGGYERTRGTGWGAEDYYGTYGTSRGTNYSAGSYDQDQYSRQDNSYRYGGEGRRYDDFNRDEDRKMFRGRSGEGYNMLGIDAYYDRGEHRERRSDNDYRGGDQNRFYGRDNDNSDLRYEGDIRSSSRDNDNYANGMYSSNRSYVSDNDDYSQRSSRYRRPGESSGPDYGADSGISNYGNQTPRA
ncbi:hypothetical protein POKO110462_02630 [Pontibacter korlensis]|uniref:Uncharacterized protein n=1 Tax=Pontibacter korlensis TaxID=400092 RepID=A0A0E3UXJ8_9BACT|nr:hypothetical protein [Pontibacter korlensis]AKD03641.1 hypothetical protein PKOR_11520 [Pontibacter korlensis]